jgi:hypothetical protein
MEQGNVVTILVFGNLALIMVIGLKLGHAVKEDGMQRDVQEVHIRLFVLIKE